MSNLLTREKLEKLGLDKKTHITQEDLRGYDVFEVGLFSYNKTLREIDIPEGFESISFGCFESCTNLSKVILPSTMKTINNYVFTDCDELREIVIPDSVFYIGEHCFCDCGLEKITLPKENCTFGYGCFCGCCNLTSIKLPNTMGAIRGTMFMNCSSLKKIEIPQYTQIICSDAFYNCTDLRSVTMSDDVERIDSCAFNGCNLSEIKLSKNLHTLSSCVFSHDMILTRHILFNKEGKMIVYKMMKVRGDKLLCRDFEYEVGKTYEIEEDRKKDVKVCSYGFHGCANPFACLNYYSGRYGTDVVMCECVLEGTTSDAENPDKVAGEKITIVKKFDSYYEAFNDYLKATDAIELK